MRVIFNSDMLYVNSFVRDALPRHLKDFVAHCADKGHEVVLPKTTVLEFDRQQAAFRQTEISTVRAAQEKLKAYGIATDDFNAEDKIGKPDLLQLISDVGIECTEVEPTKEDYDDAHKKACLREAPHPPNGKSDEMRDLIIWAVAM